MGRKTARKNIGNRIISTDSYAKFKHQSNDNNQPWLNKAKRNKSSKINTEKLDDSR